MDRAFVQGDVAGRPLLPVGKMGVQAYTIAVAFMAGLGALAALGAIALAFHQFARWRPARRPAFVFDPPVASPVLFKEPEPEPTTLEPTVLAAAPAREPELQTVEEVQAVAEVQPERTAEPEPEPEPPPPPAPHLELALMSPRAPGRLKVPVDLTRGRILELSLPLWLSSTGGSDLDDVKIRIVVPNEITYGASLERITREPLAELPGSRTSYVLAEHQTSIEIDIPFLAGGTEANIPVPISIKRAAVGAYLIQASASAPALETIERRYAIELVDVSAPDEADDGVPGWICRPDEAARVRDPHLPLDRIVSTTFGITEPGDDWAEPESVPL